MPALHRRSLRLAQATAALALTTLLAAPAAAQGWDARADYSTTTNPNGAWSYGYATALGSGATAAALTPYTVSQSVSGIHTWSMGTALCGDQTPAVLRNTTASPVTLASWTLNAGELGFHPGCGNEFSIIRFTAPTLGFTPGSYDVAASFRGADASGNRTVHLFQNGTALFSDVLSGLGTAGYSATRTLAAGDVLDLVVGANGDYRFDMTGANLVISAATPVPTSPVPEPGTWALLATGLAAIGVAGRRRRATAG